jgi:hypothetical protein
MIGLTSAYVPLSQVQSRLAADCIPFMGKCLLGDLAGFHVHRR